MTVVSIYRMFLVRLLAAAMLCIASVGYSADKPVKDPNVSNVWVDVPLTQVFRDISVETGVVLAVCPHVNDQLVSLDAGASKPLSQCIDELVAGKGLYVQKKNPRFFLISCGSSNCPSFMEGAISESVSLRYITAKHLNNSMPKSLQTYVTSGERTNEVLIYAVPEIMQKVKALIAKLDTAQQQVVLEVLVIELLERSADEFGLDWEYTGEHFGLGNKEGLGYFTAAARYTSVPKTQLTQLMFTLRSLVSNEKASIKSRPRVATLDGQMASIDVTLDEYFTIVTDSYGSTNLLRTELQVIKSGVLLNITPSIGDNGDITVHVATEVSDVAARQNQIEGNNSGDLPVIRRRKADTNVRVKDGDAIVIGGLVETQERSINKKVPLLGDLPLIGGAFKSKENSSSQKEVIIFITPRLIGTNPDPFAARHNKIDVRGELNELRQISSLLNGNIDPNTQTQQAGDIKPFTLQELREELNSLKEVAVSLQQDLAVNSDAVINKN
jgi:Flp pilus assembly secretin CpaC